MKLFYFLLVLSYSKNVKSEFNLDQWTDALSFQNLSLRPGHIGLRLHAFFDYEDSYYLSTDEQNSSEYCLAFNLQNENLTLQYACRNECMEISFDKHIQSKTELFINNIGPKHCPMEGTLSNGIIKSADANNGK